MVLGFEYTYLPTNKKKVIIRNIISGLLLCTTYKYSITTFLSTILKFVLKKMNLVTFFSREKRASEKSCTIFIVKSTI